MINAVVFLSCTFILLATAKRAYRWLTYRTNGRRT